MPQLMTPATDAATSLAEALKYSKRKTLGGAQALAGMAAPMPGSPLAALVAAIRSAVPGRGTYREEMDRYNQASTEQESVTDNFQAPGEDAFAFLQRQARSPAITQAVMAGSSMAAPIAVHASPNKWSGQPTRAAAGTGEGGAAYGEGLYATVPQNAVGVDRRYRVESEFQTPKVTVKGIDLRNVNFEKGEFDRLPSTEAQSAISQEVRRWLDGESPVPPKPEDVLFWARMKVADRVRQHQEWAARAKSKGQQYAEEANTKTGQVFQTALDELNALTPDDIAVMEPGKQGSFHVWDVPDRLMDYDAPLGKQTPEVQGAVFDGDMIPTGRESLGWRGAPDAAFQNAKAAESRTGKWLLGELGRGQGEAELAKRGIQGHTYAGEAGSARTSGIEGDVPNFVIYDDAAVKPLGTFGSAEEWLASDLYRQLKPRIDAEEALRAAGQATPEAYAEIRRRFAEAIGNAGR